MRLAVLALILATFSAQPIAAATDGPPAAAAAAKVKKICRPLPARTGSHRPQGKVCKSAEEWRVRDRDQYMQAPMEDATKVEVKGPGLG